MEWLKPRMDGYCPAGRGIMKPLLHPQMQGGGDSGLLGQLCCGWDVMCTSSCEIYEPPGQHQSSPFPCCLVPFAPSEEELQLSEQTPAPVPVRFKCGGVARFRAWPPGSLWPPAVRRRQTIARPGRPGQSWRPPRGQPPVLSDSSSCREFR